MLPNELARPLLFLLTCWLAASTWTATILAADEPPPVPSEAEPDGAVPVESAGSETPAIVARWKGGTVDQAKLDSWLRFLGPKRPGETRGPLPEIESLLLVETLARATLERGGDREPALRFALEQLEDKALAAALRKHRAKSIVVSEERIEAQIRRQPALARKPHKIRLRNILVAFPPEADDAEREVVRKRVEVLRAWLEEGADFAELAKRESDSQTRFKGGLMGNVEPEKLRSDIAAVVEELGPGQVSPPIETEDGVTLLFCEDIIEEVRRSPEEVRQMVINHFTRIEEKAGWQAFQDELLAKADARWHLDRVDAPERGDETVVAGFADQELTLAELRFLVAGLPGRPDVSGLDPARLRGLAEGWVVQKAATRRARVLGLADDPELDERLHWQRLRRLAGAELDRRILEDFAPPEEAEIRAYFEEHHGDFQHPPHYDVAVIVIPLVEGEERRHYALAQELWRDLAAGGRDFAGTAREHSQHPSAAKGGAMGWLSKRALAQFGSRPMQVLTALVPGGGLSELVQHQGQLFLFELRGFRPAENKTWEEAAGDAEKRLAGERIEGLRARIEAQLIAALDVRP